MKTNGTGETTLSTSEVGDILGISRVAVVNLCEKWGKLSALPRLHDRAHREIPAKEVVELLQRNGRPVPEHLRGMA